MTAGTAGIDELEPLRSRRLRSGFLFAVAARLARFAANLLITRAVVRDLGAEAWGILALALATVELVLAFDLAIPELAAYESASADSRAGLDRSLGNALVLSLVPGLGGSLVLAGFALLAGTGLSEAAAGSAPLVRELLLAAAVTYSLWLVGHVYAGLLNGLGRIRELSVLFVAVTAYELAVVLGGLAAGLGLAEIQWLRCLAPALRLAILFAMLRWHRLPVPRFPRSIAWPEMRRLARFATGYNLSKGFGNLEYSCDIPIAQLFAPATALGAYAAADQWANKPYRFSHAVYESIYHRLTRNLRSGASPAERAQGAAQFMGATLLITVVVVPAGGILLAVAPALFHLWIGEAGREAVVLLPWLLSAWILNAVASPSTCVILATGRFGPSVRAHVAAVALNVAGDFALGWLYGMKGVVLSTLVANVLLATLLARSACALTGRSFRDYLAWNAAPLAALAVAALLAVAGAPSGPRWAAGAGTVAACLAVAWASPDFRTLLRRSSGEGQPEAKAD